ncbi:MAG TPA: O-methyltransferase [Solirubrobacterales bacterium]|nr:O-methyltransferase [Solirubrobacterales bacterium]
MAIDQETFAAVDEFVEATLAPDDEALRGAVDAADAAGLPAIQVSAAQGRLLTILARLVAARAILEFGTLGGYSTICLARGLEPGGRIVTLEVDPHHAEVARDSIARAGFEDAVEVRVGPALASLPGLEAEGAGPFDLAFIDADKVNTPAYVKWALDRTRPGGLVVADNVVRDGRLAEDPPGDEAIAAQRRLHRQLAEDPRAEATTIQTVGVKGYDGFTIVCVKAA